MVCSRIVSMHNSKTDIYIFEPNLDTRKPLAQLFPLSKFLIKFFSSSHDMFNEIRLKIPHIVVFNLDDKNLDYLEELKEIMVLLPKETYILGMSEKVESKRHSPLFEKGLQEVWQLPIAGLKIKPRINEIMDEGMKPIIVNFTKQPSLKVVVDGKIVAMGETDFIAKFPVQFSHGEKVDIHSTFLNSVLKEEKKVMVVSEDNHGVIVENQITVSILGLKNDDLKNIRARILNWEKL